jgi:transcriptional regulator with GAF, ATPase, and Fis domain
MTAIYDATRDLKDLARLASEPENLPEVLSRALDSLQKLIPHDLAAVLGLAEGELRVLAARGRLADEKVRQHSIRLRDFPSIARAFEHRRPVVLREHDHSGGEGDPYDGILDLPHGHSCMVVPLYAGERNLGLITFDRVVCDSYQENTVEMAEVYGQIISLAFRYAEQAELLERYRQQLDERQRVLASRDEAHDPAAPLEGSRSPVMRGLVAQAKQVAGTTAPVLILGETGTGKEVLARALHHWSPRRAQAFLSLNCAAIPESLLESELFGHVKGAFTGAGSARPGRFLAANGGTLLLDEIGDMPSAAQAKLLRVLQEGTFEPVGSDRTVKVDVRILAATHRDLEERVRAGAFREDLFYRLNVFPLHVPPLRERADDLPRLVATILAGLARRTGRGPWTVDDAALRELAAQEWPGNVRQLVNALERATIMKSAGALDARFFMGGTRRAATGEGDATVTMAETTAAEVDADRDLTLAAAERRHLRHVLELCGGRIYGADGAAERLGLKPTTLQSRMKKLGVGRRG